VANVARVRAALANPIVQVTAANLTSVGLGTISGVLTARGLGPEGRGHWAVVMAFFTVALVVAELGQSGAVTFLVARDPEHRRKVVRRARNIMCAGGIAVAAAGFLAAPALAGGDSQTGNAYRLAAVGIVINSLFAGQLFAMQAISIPRWNIARVAQPLFYVLGLATMLVLGRVSVTGVAIALIASTSLQFVVLWSLRLSHRKCEASDDSTEARAAPTGPRSSAQTSDVVTTTPTESLSQGGYGIRYAAAAVPTVLTAQYDKIILSRLVGPADVGFYAVGSTVALLVAPFSAAIANVAFPRASKRELSGAQRRTFEITALLQVFFVSVVVSACLCAVAPVAVPILFGPDFAAAIPVVWALAAVMVARAISQVAGVLIRARGLPGAAAVAQISGLALGAGLMFPCVNAFGLLGAAIALGVGEVATLSVVLISLFRLQGADRVHMERESSA